MGTLFNLGHTLEVDSLAVSSETEAALDNDAGPSVWCFNLEVHTHLTLSLWSDLVM